MHDRKPFLEILSTQATAHINGHTFDVSSPIALQGVAAEVIVTSLSEMHLERVKRIGYRRFDLSTLGEVAIKRNKSVTYGDVAQSLNHLLLFKYRILLPGFQLPQVRFASLQRADVVDELLGATPYGSKITLQASPQSDLFIGKLVVRLT